MLKRIYSQLTPLQHLTTVTVFMFAACALTYAIPPMEGLRPWIPGEEDFPIVNFCIQAALDQLSKGRFFLLENFQGSRMWQTACMLHFGSQEGVTWDTLSMCAFGMKDLASGSGNSCLKAVSPLQNFPLGTMHPILRRCPNKDMPSTSPASKGP